MNDKLLDYYDEYKFEIENKQEKYNHLLLFINNYKIFLQIHGVKVKKLGSYGIYRSKHIFYNPCFKCIEWNSFLHKKKSIFLSKIKNIQKSEKNDTLLYLYYNINNSNKCATFLFQNTFDRNLFFDGIYGFLSIS
jgi:hypothetical protein